MKLKLLSSLRPAYIMLLTGCLFASGAMAQTTPTGSNDATNVYYSIPYSSTPKFVRIYLDTDHNRSTDFGSQELGVGAEFLFENGTLYRQQWKLEMGFCQKRRVHFIGRRGQGKDRPRVS